LILQDSLDRYTWVRGQLQGIIDYLMVCFWTCGFSDVDAFAVIPFHGGSDAHMSGQPFPDSGPTVIDSLASQVDANTVQDMISQDRYEEMAVCPVFILMIYRAHPQL